MPDNEPTVKGSWPLVRLIDGVPHWYIAGTNPPQYARDEALERVWRARQKTHAPLSFISLFAGIGGIDLGLERAGMRCVAQVEIDDYANRVLAKHWPQVRRFRDVRECGAHNLPRADVIAGGFPCQDISNAGKRAGITGERSGLWFEFARIIGELRPRYVLVENVAALLHRGIDRVLGDLAALGFDAEWHCIPAAALGAPHRRDRLYLVAYANQKRWSTPRTNEEQAGFNLSPISSRQRRTQIERFTAWQVEPDVGRVAHGIPNQSHRLGGLGNAVVPQCAELIGRAIVAHAEQEPAHA